MKIMIFGRPGSGKSTLAADLNRTLNLPIYHLDKYFYTQNWQERNYKEFLEIQQKLVDLNNWIIDGNCIKSLEMRYCKADVVAYFLLPKITCLYRIIKRRFSKNLQIDDRALNCPEKITLKFILYIWMFNWRVKKEIKRLQVKYPNTKFYKINSDQDVSKLKKLLLGDKIWDNLDYYSL
jgi:adenylate kinase family enzyme